MNSAAGPVGRVWLPPTRQVKLAILEPVGVRLAAYGYCFVDGLWRDAVSGTTGDARDRPIITRFSLTRLAITPCGTGRPFRARRVSPPQFALRLWAGEVQVWTETQLVVLT